MNKKLTWRNPPEELWYDFGYAGSEGWIISIKNYEMNENKRIWSVIVNSFCNLSGAHLSKNFPDCPLDEAQRQAEDILTVWVLEGKVAV